MVVGGGGVGCGGCEVVSTSGEASGAGVEDAWPKGIICSAASTLKNRVSGGVYVVADALRKNGCQPGWAVVVPCTLHHSSWPASRSTGEL
jgi:hypothetical protein